MTHRSDVLIIGGGAIGICSAHYLLQRGRSVALLEKGEICSGSSYGNAGLIVPSHSIPLANPDALSKGLRWMLDPESPFYIRPRLNLEFLTWLRAFRRFCTPAHVRRTLPLIHELSLASRALFEELAALDGLDFGFQEKGHLGLFSTPEGLEEGIEEARLLAEHGIEARVLTPDEIRRLQPGIRFRVEGGVHFLKDAHLIPDQFVGGLARRLQRDGAEIHTGTEVLGLETSGRSVTAVKTTRGDFAAHDVVLAGGAWSSGIARYLRLKLPIQPAKGYSITFKRPPTCPEIPLTLGESRVAVTPMGEHLRFAGTLELAGMDMSINRRRVRAILHAVPQYLPDLDPGHLEQVEIWRGLRPCTPDGLPFLGRSRVWQNLVVAAGHAMIGISLSPITGKLVAQLVTNEEPGIDLMPLRAERFT